MTRARAATGSCPTTGAAPLCAALGDPHGVLLAGPAADQGAEALADHRARLGTPPARTPDEILTELRASGLRGRGGGGFPLWRKLEAARDADVRSGRAPLVVINCSESEPASRKDWTLCSYRPHVVLDGAAAIAKGLAARHVVLHLHADAVEPREALRRALEERVAEPDPRWRLSLGPGGYVSGEASAVVRYLDEGVAKPRFSRVPLAAGGPHDRPVVVSNAETAAQAAAIVSAGAYRWRTAGSSAGPGPHLVTLDGAVPEPGRVLELTGRVTFEELLTHAGVPAPPKAVLVGGYAGTWLRGEAAWSVPIEAEALGELGASLGCGLVSVVGHADCVLSETARLARYLADESAGQCGPCVHGLPVLARAVLDLAQGRGGRRALRQVRRAFADLPGSGACRHPDGVVRLVASALESFPDEVARHHAGAPCASASAGREGGPSRSRGGSSR